MNGQFFEPSPELQALIDEAHDRRLRERQNSEWTSGRGVVIDPDALRQRSSHRARVQASSATAFSSSAVPYHQIQRSPYSFSAASVRRDVESALFFGA